MRKFTPTEKDLCKKIAEKERKEIVFGTWFHDLGDPDHEPFLWCNLTDELKGEHNVPLWQEHDCLEYLREKGYRILLHWNDYGAKVELNHGVKNVPLFFDRVKTPLEALLSAILAVMET